ncbi:hypothetical protein [Streptomyces sp. NPDC060184]
MISSIPPGPTDFGQGSRHGSTPRSAGVIDSPAAGLIVGLIPAA